MSTVKIPYREIMQRIKDDIDYVAEEAFNEGKDVWDYAAGFSSGMDTDAKDAYQKGLNDAWEAARKIFHMTPDLRGKVLDCPPCVYEDVVNLVTVFEAIEKLRQWEQKKDEIQVGDEVEIVSGFGSYGVVSWIHPEASDVYVIRRDGSAGDEEKNDLKKTGRHFPQVAELLKAMQEGQDER